MTASMLNREHAVLAREAQDIADAAARLANDIPAGLTAGEEKQLARAVQQFLVRATRASAMREVATLYEAEIAPTEER
ncbi:hypothetical protein [Streptomyces xinghaiensis]|uniref:hypothetical protein n=1 Tax=Streptomyces xinghaiensis TaxID=1038928 RepID=UPI0002FA96CF|nr:hypothetical protein [Streptomyces xinghaiensis]MZE76804.1 hypothetical protein [Streptomyces sp. SID5475]